MQPTPVEGISVDPGVYVPCPASGFANRPAAKACPACEHFRGLAMLSDNIALPWEERFLINCGRPITRRTIRVLDQ